MADVFKAISDPTRRMILLRLAQNPSSINNISDDFNISRPAVSKHIKVLESCELIKIEQDESDGRQRNCYAQLEALSEVNAYLQKLDKFWSERFDKLGQFLDENN